MSLSQTGMLFKKSHQSQFPDHRFKPSHHCLNLATISLEYLIGFCLLDVSTIRLSRVLGILTPDVRMDHPLPVLFIWDMSEKRTHPSECILSSIEQRLHFQCNERFGLAVVHHSLKIVDVNQPGQATDLQERKVRGISELLELLQEITVAAKPFV